MSEPKLTDVELASVTELANRIGLKTAAGRTALRIACENVLLLDRKQQDYGSHNIRKGGIFGCVLRSSDKFERLFHMFEAKRRRPVNESIRDSFRDISNYMIIAVMLDNNEWPSE